MPSFESKRAGKAAPSVSAAYQEATGLRQRGDLVEAERVCRSIIKTRPDYFDATHLLGVVLLERRLFESAERQIARAIGLNPDSAAAHNNLGNALQGLGKFEDAVASYDRALVLRPNHAGTHYNRGNAFTKLNRLDEAIAQYKQALAIEPPYAGAHHALGNALRKTGQLDDAISHYEKALVATPNYFDAQLNLAHALQEKGRLDDAIKQYKRAIVIKPDRSDAFLGLGNAMKSQKRFIEAIEQYDRAITVKPGYAEAHLNRGSALLEVGRMDEAASSAEAAAMFLDQGSPSLCFSIGLLFARSGRKEHAMPHLRRYLELDPDDARGARLILAGVGVEPMPQQASEANLLRIYDRRAKHWGGKSTTYRGHELVARAIADLCPSKISLDILDAGCGTGLVGILVRSFARRLDGVDLSSAMLQRAEETKAYSSLHHGDLVEFFRTNPASYDVIVSAATLIHFGDLKPVFAGAATAIRGDGLLVFTLFPNGESAENNEVAVAPLGGLGEGGCYLHGRGHVANSARETGFAVVLMEKHVHEIDIRGKPRSALVVALRRATPESTIPTLS